MGHHHKKNKSTKQQEPVSISDFSPPNNNSPNNLDFTSLLGNLNLNNIDLNKVDMDKVKSIMERIAPSQNPIQGANSGNYNSIDTRINLVNSLKELMPSKRSRMMDNISKLLQISQIINNNRGLFNNNNYNRHNYSHR